MQACQVCWVSTNASTHKCHRTGRVWSINAPINCTTPNVVYKLTCKKCNKFLYIGKTKRCLKHRINEHRGYISQKKVNQPAGEHFNSPGHSIADLQVVGIERVFARRNEDIDKILEQREKWWINEYDSVTFGNNKDPGSNY